MPRARQADIAVIGAGIVGLAHAYEAARRGPLGCSLRRLDPHRMILPLGMTPGIVHPSSNNP